MMQCKCKHVNKNGHCMKNASSSGCCSMPCSYYESKYKLRIPGVGVCCEAYYKSKRNDGLEWMHFPFCSEENCPLKHPELLEGAILETEE